MPVWGYIITARIEEFRHTLDNACHVTNQRFQKVMPLIYHSVAIMVRELRFAFRDFSSLTDELITYHFSIHCKDGRSSGKNE